MTNQWEIIHNEHYATLIRSMMNRTDGNSQLAEDIVAATFEKLMSSYPDGVTGITNLGGLLQTTAERKFIDIYRRETKHRDKKVDEEGMENWDYASNADVEEEAFTAVQMLEVKKMIDALPTEFKDVMNLLYEGMSYDEIASQLNISIGTVKSRISRSKQKMGL